MIYLIVNLSPLTQLHHQYLIIMAVVGTVWVWLALQSDDSNCDLSVIILPIESLPCMNLSY